MPPGRAPRCPPPRTPGLQGTEVEFPFPPRDSSGSARSPRDSWAAAQEAGAAGRRSQDQRTPGAPGPPRNPSMAMPWGPREQVSDTRLRAAPAPPPLPTSPGRSPKLSAAPIASQLPCAPGWKIWGVGGRAGPSLSLQENGLTSARIGRFLRGESFSGKDTAENDSPHLPGAHHTGRLPAPTPGRGLGEATYEGAALCPAE